MNDSNQDQATDGLFKALLILWFLLLLPWLPTALLAGMAFDGGSAVLAYLFVSSVWSYPLVLVFATTLQLKDRRYVLLPLINVLGFCISNWFPLHR